MWNIMPQMLKNKTLKSCLLPVSCYGADGAIDPAADVAILNKGTAGAYTLAAPSGALNGHVIRIVSDSAAAHVVTATDLLHDGVTGGAKDTATFAAFKGASIELMAYGGLWYVQNKNVVTVAAV